jgi:hypothetical protein
MVMVPNHYLQAHAVAVAISVILVDHVAVDRVVDHQHQQQQLVILHPHHVHQQVVVAVVVSGVIHVVHHQLQVQVVEVIVHVNQVNMVLTVDQVTLDQVVIDHMIGISTHIHLLLSLA